MPEPAYKSITVKKEVYDHLMAQYKQKEKEWLVKRGINSFAAYVVYQLNELIEAQTQNPQQFAP